MKFNFSMRACAVFASVLTCSAPAIAATNPAVALAQIATQIPTHDALGQVPVSASNIKFTSDELARIKAKHARAAIVLHYGGNDWSRAQVEGLRAEFASLNIQVIAVTDAGFKPEKQVADIETVLAQKPDVIVSIPTDPVATANAYKKAAQAGVKLIFMGNVPKGFVPGKDYVSNVSPNDYGNGVASAHLLAQALGPQGGKIGLIYHAATDFFQTRQRYLGLKKTITHDYPNIKIVEEQGIGGPDFAGDAEKAASAMLTAHRDIKGIWAVWDVPAEGVIAAARDAGRDNLVISTVDLGENAAIDMASGDHVKGIAAQRPYDQGVTEAMLAGFALIGKPAPAAVAWPIIPVTRQNLLQAWAQVYHHDAPANIRKSLQ